MDEIKQEIETLLEHWRLDPEFCLGVQSPLCKKFCVEHHKPVSKTYRDTREYEVVWYHPTPDWIDGFKAAYDLITGP